MFFKKKFNNWKKKACELAQKHLIEIFSPLLQHLITRSVYIMKRLPNVALAIMKIRKNQKLSIYNQNDDYDRYPFFASHVNGLYEEFVNRIAREVDKKFNDELLDASTILYYIKM